MKTRKVREVIWKEVPWNRKENVPDAFKPGDEHKDSCNFVTVPKGTRFFISVGNEAADALEEYEVELLKDVCAQIQGEHIAKVIRKIDDQPL